MNDKQLEKALKKHYAAEDDALGLPDKASIPALSKKPRTKSKIPYRRMLAAASCLCLAVIIVFTAVTAAGNGGSAHPEQSVGNVLEQLPENSTLPSVSFPTEPSVSQPDEPSVSQPDDPDNDISIDIPYTPPVTERPVYATPISTVDLMKDIKANTLNTRKADNEFISGEMDFSVEIFKQVCKENKSTNVMSPLSIQLALAMTANGAANDTLHELEKLLCGGMDIGRLNEYLGAITEKCSDRSKQLTAANSIWFRDELPVKNTFLQKTADRYRASAYASPFDDGTVDDINAWIEDKTDGMIKDVFPKGSLDPNTVMILINALRFDAKWESKFPNVSVHDEAFTSYSGEKRTVEGMNGQFDKYIYDTSATGFIKYYEGRQYAFAALRPNDGVDVFDYISSLTGEKLNAILSRESDTAVRGFIPKFKADSIIQLKELLAELGVNDAFSACDADFTEIIDEAIEYGLHIGGVIHAATIEVDEEGTKAAAITAIIAPTGCEPSDSKEVNLDRPFVYMIIDTDTNLPVFMGVITDIN